MILIVVIKALLIGIVVGALLFWFSSRKQGKLATTEGQVDSDDVGIKGGLSVFISFVKNLFLLILLLILPLFIIRIVL